MTLITRIDPDLPLCWEDADTVRIGFERAQARVRRPSAGAQRLIGTLCSGVPSDGIAHEARRVGATPEETRQVLDALEPALLREEASRGVPRRPAPRRPLRAALSDDGRDAPGLRRALGGSGLFALDTAISAESSELVFHVERYLEPLERAQRWLAAGVPHLLIRYTDRCVQIGPLITGSRGPCHSCLSLAIVAGDAAVPALAAQLYGKSPQSETSAVAEMAAAFALRFVRQWLAGDVAAHRTRTAISVSRGRISGDPRTETVTPHPGCGCQGL